MDEMGIIRSLRAESRSWRDDRNVASLRYILSVNYSSNNVMAGFLLTTVTKMLFQCFRFNLIPGLFELFL